MVKSNLPTDSELKRLQSLETLDDLAEDPINPRKMEVPKRTRLKRSLKEFGDISGITFNLTTGQLVTGHQRVKSLREEHGALTLVRQPDGRIRFAVPGQDEPIFVRLVQWSEEKQRQANIAANHKELQGEFTEQLQEQLIAMRDSGPDIYEALNFDAIVMETPNFTPSSDNQAKLDEKKKTICPNCSHEFTP